MVGYLILSPFVIAFGAAWLVSRYPQRAGMLAAWPLAIAAFLGGELMGVVAAGPRRVELLWAPSLGLTLSVLRMPDVFTRMQASTKASTLGLGCLLIGTAIQLGDFAAFIRVASIGAFVLLTMPVSGLVIARAAYFADVPLWKGTVLDERRAGTTTEGETDDPGSIGERGPSI